jgi:protein-S-isoprenylcysteine O-methyltransferase Ste14
MKKKISIVKMVISATLKLVSFLALMFLLSWRIDYWQGWLFIIATLVATISIFLIFRKKMDLFKERVKPGPGTKTWDKVFWFFNLLFFLAILIIGPLDAGRFMWSPEIPLYWYFIGYITHFIGYYIILWSMYINNFFSSVVRIQKDRGQKVIQDGPYKYIRHPGYVGAFFIAPSTALILGSLWAMIPAVLWIIALIIRTALEDATLQKELEGYKEYTKKTKYRLIPGIW